jgi:hypothetical protein
MDGPNKLEFFPLKSLSSLAICNIGLLCPFISYERK